MNDLLSSIRDKIKGLRKKKTAKKTASSGTPVVNSNVVVNVTTGGAAGNTADADLERMKSMGRY